MKVPFCDLAAALQPVRKGMFDQFEKALDDMNLLLGPNTRAFETEFSDHCQSQHGISLSNAEQLHYVADSVLRFVRGEAPASTGAVSK